MPDEQPKTRCAAQSTTISSSNPSLFSRKSAVCSGPPAWGYLSANNSVHPWFEQSRWSSSRSVRSVARRARCFNPARMRSCGPVRPGDSSSTTYAPLRWLHVLPCGQFGSCWACHPSDVRSQPKEAADLRTSVVHNSMWCTGLLMSGGYPHLSPASVPQLGFVCSFFAVVAQIARSCRITFDPTCSTISEVVRIQVQ